MTVVMVVIGTLFVTRNIDIAIADSHTPPQDQAADINMDVKDGCIVYQYQDMVGKDLLPMTRVICDSPKH